MGGGVKFTVPCVFVSLNLSLKNINRQFNHFLNIFTENDNLITF